VDGIWPQYEVGGWISGSDCMMFKVITGRKDRREFPVAGN